MMDQMDQMDPGVLKQNHVRELNVSLMKSVAFTGGVQDLTANLENAA